jgi:hypothetical protein
LAPHSLPLGFTHCPLAVQQPPQLYALQVGLWQPPPRHVSPGGQVTQALPPPPHWPTPVPAWQLPSGSQQPLQLDGLHPGLTHSPDVHESAAGQDEQEPPFAPH